MITVLDPDTYAPLSNIDGGEHTIERVAYAELAVIGAEDRRQNAYMRGLCSLFFKWIRANFQLRQPSHEYPDVGRFIDGFVVLHFSALDTYLHKREETLGPSFGVPGCTVESLMQKIVVATPRGSPLPDLVGFFNEQAKLERRNNITVRYTSQLHRVDMVQVPTHNIFETVEMGRNLGDEICEGGTEPCE